MNAQEANGEQREKNGGKFAETDDFGRAVLKRKPPETAPTLGKRAKKIPTDKGWDFKYWWRRGGLNPRPKILYSAFYILSHANLNISFSNRRQTGCVKTSYLKSYFMLSNPT